MMFRFVLRQVFCFSVAEFFVVLPDLFVFVGSSVWWF